MVLRDRGATAITMDTTPPSVLSRCGMTCGGNKGLFVFCALCGLAGTAAHADSFDGWTVVVRTRLVVHQEAPIPAGIARYGPFRVLDDRRAVMDVRGWRPSEVVFGGLRPHGLCRVTAVKKTHDERADATGRLSLLLAPRTTVSLDFNPPSDVALH